MKNRLLLSFYILLGLFVITGCEKLSEKNIVEDAKVDNNTFNGYNEYLIDCDKLVTKDIMAIGWIGDAYSIAQRDGSYYFITTDGEFYDLNLKNIYSNGKNCKIDEDRKKVVRYLSEYEIEYEGDISKYDKDIVSMQTSLSYYENSNHFNALKKDGNIYHIESKGTGPNTLAIVDEEIILTKAGFEDRNILKYTGSSIGVKEVVITEDVIYKIESKVRNEECNKYTDVKCEYFLKPVVIEDLTQRINEIKYYDGLILLTKDGKLYIQYEF